MHVLAESGTSGTSTLEVILTIMQVCFYVYLVAILVMTVPVVVFTVARWLYASVSKNASYERRQSTRGIPHEFREPKFVVSVIAIMAISLSFAVRGLVIGN